MISIIDYGLGNILAFENIYNKLNIPVQIVKTPNELKKSTKFILPGVGSFDWAITRLNNSGLRDKLEDLVINKGVPILGVCVGMQVMASESDEGSLCGLGWLDAKVKSFCKDNFTGYRAPIPHMGWNIVAPRTNSHLFHQFNDNPNFYFLHSYYFKENRDDQVLASTNYGVLFTSAAYKNNIFGVQFHPEKSHECGIQLLKNFALNC